MLYELSMTGETSEELQREIEAVSSMWSAPTVPGGKVSWQPSGALFSFFFGGGGGGGGEGRGKGFWVPLLSSQPTS